MTGDRSSGVIQHIIIFKLLGATTIKLRQVQTVSRSLQTALTASLHGHDGACTEGSVPDGVYFLYMETYMLLEDYFPPSHKPFVFLY